MEGFFFKNKINVKSLIFVNLLAVRNIWINNKHAIFYDNLHETKPNIMKV